MGAQTDYDRLTELLTAFGVGFEVITTKDGEPAVECHEGHEKIDGYSGFFTVFEFDQDGRFKVMGAYER